MSLCTSKISGSPVVTSRADITESCTSFNYFAKYLHYSGSSSACQRIEVRRQSYGRALGTKLSFSSGELWSIRTKPCTSSITHEHSVQCQSTGTHNANTKECARDADALSDLPRAQMGEEEVETLFDTLLPEDPVMHKNTQGLAEVCKFVYNDAKYVNERARNDIFLLSRGIMKLNDRAWQDVAVLGSGFLKLDARAREDTGKIDHGVKRKAECLNHIATILKDKAQSKLKSAADKHWNDGALEADLRRADLLAKRRAMEDAFMALKFVKNVHDEMVSNFYKLPLHRKQGPLSDNDMTGIMLEKNGEMIDFLHGKVSSDRITAIQEVYWSMASAFSEADGIDYTDPEELELLVATLLDLDAMDGKSSVSLLAECSISPDVNTRKALANALASAPSMWALGNAGMGALQRLSNDSNPAIASAASKVIKELKKQWEIEEGDSWRFTMNETPVEDIDED